MCYNKDWNLLQIKLNVEVSEAAASRAAARPSPTPCLHFDKTALTKSLEVLDTGHTIRFAFLSYDNLVSERLVGWLWLLCLCFSGLFAGSLGSAPAALTKWSPWSSKDWKTSLYSPAPKPTSARHWRTSGTPPAATPYSFSTLLEVWRHHAVIWSGNLQRQINDIRHFIFKCDIII